MVLFIGDGPNRIDKETGLPFVDPRYASTLRMWINKIAPLEAKILNSHNEALLERIKKHNELGNVFVALGNAASKRLKKMEIPHFKLPNPSSKNRKIDDQDYVNSELDKCRDYLKGLGKCV